MPFRCVKNDNNVIINIGNDEDQSGNYPVGSSDEGRIGVWCTWTMDEIPVFEHPEGAEPFANVFQENAEGDGIEMRSEEDILASPNA